MRVFRIKRGTKTHFIDRAWTVSATASVADIFDEWRGQPFNVGLLMNGFVAIDVDVKGGKPGLASLAAIEKQLPRTYRQRTPTGGLHLIFKNPPGFEFSNSVCKLGEGLDVRAHNGYVLGAGSEVGEGFYSVEDNAPIAVAPPWLVERLAVMRKRDPATPKFVGEVDTPSAIQNVEAYLRSAEPAVEGAGGNDATYVVANAAMDRGVWPGTAAELMLEHWNERCSPPWDDGDLRTIVMNAASYRHNPIGCYRPEAGFCAVELPSAEKRYPISFWLENDAEDDAVKWLIDEAIPCGGIGFEGGKSGSGKTFLAVHTAVCGALGRPFFGRAVSDPFGTYFVAAEGGYSIKQRVRAAAVHGFGLNPIVARSLPFKFTKGAPDLMSASGLAAFIEDIKQTDEAMRARYDMPLGLIVFDTFGQTFALREENSPTEVTKATKIMHRCAAAVGASALATHHFGHGPERLRGSSAFRANADFVIEVRERGEIFLEKCRDAPEVRLGWMGLPIVEIGRKSDGAPITSRFVRELSAPASAATRPKKITGAELKSWADIMSAFDRVKIPDLDHGADKADIAALRAAFIEVRGGNKDAARRNFRRQREKMLSMGYVMDGQWLRKPGPDMTDMSAF